MVIHRKLYVRQYGLHFSTVLSEVCSLGTIFSEKLI